MNKTVLFIRQLLKESAKNDYLGLASEIGYNFILSIFPFAIFIVAIFGILGTEDGISKLSDFYNRLLPPDITLIVTEILKSIINSGSNQILSIFGLLTTLYTASGVVLVIKKGLNRAYNITESRPGWFIIILVVLILIIITIVIFLSFNLTVFGRYIFSLASEFIDFPPYIQRIIPFLSWFTAFISLFLMILVVYYYLPDIKYDKRALLKGSTIGALFFSTFWLISSWLFSLYLSHFARFNIVYGTLGTVIALLVWFYYTSLIILLGGEISSLTLKTIRSRVFEVKP